MKLNLKTSDPSDVENTENYELEKINQHKPVLLVILDGFGVSPDKFGSPWEIAEHSTFSEIEKHYPFTTIQASGIAVGLPWGKEGNSEVGHLTIGAGKIILNYLPQISTAIEDKSFFDNETFISAIKHAETNNSSLHLMGLFSSGTVHSYVEHLYALLELTKQKNVGRVFLHLFTDGKDAYEKEGANFFKKFEEKIKTEYPNASIASVIGRKYSMDRDGNWDRTEKAYNLLTKGEGEEFDSASDYINSQYQKDIFDTPMEAGLSGGETSRIKNDDAVIFYNFREDSPRQITRAFTDKDFGKFEREYFHNLFFVTMTEYDKNLPARPAYESAKIEYPLARIVEESGLTQFHVSESEKYAHITFFLNGGRETAFEHEERILIESPRVPSYDEAPEMSADKVTESIISALDKYDFIVANFANADMVGHTGNIEATAKAIEKIDESLGKIIEKVLSMDAVMIITADHGNAEEKIYKKTGEKKSMHSINPVPFYLISNKHKREQPLTEEQINKTYKEVMGTLTDVAPTVLGLLEIKKPASMTGKNLLEKLTTN